MIIIPILLHLLSIYPTIYPTRHLEKINVLQQLPLDKWYESCFARVLNKSTLVRIWDKVCGGSRKIVVFVCLMLLNVLSRRIMQHNKLEDILAEIASVSFTIFIFLHQFILYYFRSKTIWKRPTMLSINPLKCGNKTKITLNS